MARSNNVRAVIRMACLPLIVLLLAGLILVILGAFTDTVDGSTSQSMKPSVTRPVASYSHPDAGYPPFWHRTAPHWCAEDMPCWIGSTADGRSDSASLKDWSYQMHIAQDDLRTVNVRLPHHSQAATIAMHRVGGAR